MSQTTSSVRIADIVRQIRGAALPFLGANEQYVDARSAAQAAGNGLSSTRESIMCTLADLSRNGQWTEGEIKVASNTAAGLSKNETEKALATFIGQCKKAMDPKVRSFVGQLVAVRDLGWEAETLAIAEDSDAPRPLRKAFARGYHCLMEMFALAGEGRVISDTVELLAFAAERDPDLSLEKVLKRLNSISAQLSKFYIDWPVDDIQLCVDTLNEVTEKALRAARSSARSSTVVAEKPFTPAVPAAVVVAVNKAVDNAKTPENDFLDDVLGATA